MIVLLAIVLVILLDVSRPHAIRAAAFVAWCAMATIIGVALVALYAAQEGLIP